MSNHSQEKDSDSLHIIFPFFFLDALTFCSFGWGQDQRFSPGAMYTKDDGWLAPLFAAFSDDGRKARNMMTKVETHLSRKGEVKLTDGFIRENTRK